MTRNVRLARFPIAHWLKVKSAALARQARAYEEWNRALDQGDSHACAKWTRVRRLAAIRQQIAENGLRKNLYFDA